MRLNPAEGDRPARMWIVGLAAKPALLAAAKVLVSASLLVWVIGRVRAADPSMRLDEGDWRCIALVLLIQSALPIVQAQRWRLIAAALGNRLPFGTAVSNVYIGQFFNQILPSSVGGDAARIWKLTRLMSFQAALTSVAFDRIVALLAVPIIIITGAGILVGLEPPGPFRWTLLAVIAAMAGGLALLLCGDRIPLPAALCGRQPVEFVRSISRAARRLFSDPGCLARALTLAIVIHVGVGTSLWLLAVGNSVDVPIAVFLVLAPLITMITTVPISIAGWGVREGAAVAVLGLVGVAPASALAISVQFGLIMMVVGVPGGILTLLEAMKRRDAPAGRSRQIAGGAGQPEAPPAAALPDGLTTR